MASVNGEGNVSVGATAPPGHVKVDVDNPVTTVNMKKSLHHDKDHTDKKLDTVVKREVAGFRGEVKSFRDRLVGGITIICVVFLLIIILLVLSHIKWDSESQSGNDDSKLIMRRKKH